MRTAQSSDLGDATTMTKTRITYSLIRSPELSARLQNFVFIQHVYFPACVGVAKNPPPCLLAARDGANPSIFCMFWKSNRSLQCNVVHLPSVVTWYNIIQDNRKWVWKPTALFSRPIQLIKQIHHALFLLRLSRLNNILINALPSLSPHAFLTGELGDHFLTRSP